MDATQIRKQIRELKLQLEKRLQEEFGLSQFDAGYLSMFGPDAVADAQGPVEEAIKEAVIENWNERGRLALIIQRQKETEAMILLERFESGERLNNQELDQLVEFGFASHVYDDPDSNRPTGIVTKTPGNPHADWEHEEGLAQIGL